MRRDSLRVRVFLELSSSRKMEMWEVEICLSGFSGSFLCLASRILMSGLEERKETAVLLSVGGETDEVEGFF